MMEQTIANAAFQRMLEAVRAELRKQTPEGRIESLDPAKLIIDPSREPEVAALFDSYTDQLVQAATDRVAFEKVWRKLAQEVHYGGFSQAKPEPLQQEVWKRELAMFGWEPEFAALFNDAGGLVGRGQKITYIDWWTIRIDGFDHSHESVRQRGGMRGRPIPTRAEVEKQAETDPAIREVLRQIDAR